MAAETQSGPGIPPQPSPPEPGLVLIDNVDFNGDLDGILNPDSPETPTDPQPPALAGMRARLAAQAPGRRCFASVLQSLRAIQGIEITSVIPPSS